MLKVTIGEGAATRVFEGRFSREGKAGKYFIGEKQRARYFVCRFCPGRNAGGCVHRAS